LKSILNVTIFENGTAMVIYSDGTTESVHQNDVTNLPLKLKELNSNG
jgi:hypothetical protein